jgi:superfamily II DNA or RNA helicase
LKTYCQAFTYGAWHKLNSILAIPLKQVFNQTYKKFVELFPDKHIGRVGDGYTDVSKDITITTFKSLKKCSLEKCELLMVDELQSSTGEQFQEIIASMRPKRIFGYTATDEGMFNNSDKLITGLFGERLIYIPYDEAREAGAVVPGVVYFLKVPNVLITSKTFEGVMSQGIKNCKERNQLIAKVCTLIPKNWATLIFVEHIQDHLTKLHEYMPLGTKFIHRNSSKTQIGNFALTAKQQDTIVNEFSNNNFQFLIATDAFRAGVDIPHLRVVIQASSGSSKVEILQEALRGSRTLPEDRRIQLDVDKKTHFVLIDFLDEHDPKLYNMAINRRKIYEEQGWKIHVVDSPKDIDWKAYK